MKNTFNDVVDNHKNNVQSFMAGNIQFERADSDNKNTLSNAIEYYCKEFGQYILTSIKPSCSDFIMYGAFAPHLSFREVFRRMLWDVLELNDKRLLKNIVNQAYGVQSLTVKIGNGEKITFTVQRVFANQCDSFNEREDSNE